MKSILFSFFTMIINVSLAQELNFNALVGEWKFIELQDEDGIAQSEIPIKRGAVTGIEVVNRDDYILNADSTYISSNKYATASGIWFFDSERKAINFQMTISPDNIAFDKLMEYGLVNLHADGLYYHKPTPIRILRFDGNHMVLDERENYELIYQKIKH